MIVREIKSPHILWIRIYTKNQEAINMALDFAGPIRYYRYSFK